MSLLNENEYFTEAGLAKELGRCERTVKNLRYTGAGPAFIRLGKQIFYRKEAVLAWLVGKEQKPQQKQVAM